MSRMLVVVAVLAAVAVAVTAAAVANTNTNTRTGHKSKPAVHNNSSVSVRHKSSSAAKLRQGETPAANGVIVATAKPQSVQNKTLSASGGAKHKPKQPAETVDEAYDDAEDDDEEEDEAATVGSAAVPSSSCLSLEPASSLGLDDKLVLSPIVFVGRLVSRSNVYNSLYFASFRVLRVVKGRLPARLRKHIRLLFKAENEKSNNQRAVSSPHSSSSSSNPCSFPIAFSVKSEPKFVLFVRKVSAAQYVAVARPQQWDQQAKRVAKKMLCDGCASAPKVTKMSPASSWLQLTEGATAKLRCHFEGNPVPEVEWTRNGYVLKEATFRTRIQSKKRKSTLRIANVQRSDAAKYMCRVKNSLGEDSHVISINVSYTAVPDPSVSACPIDSFCLNGGSCMYYEILGELVCRCRDGFAGHRCQFKKAQIDVPLVRGEACGPYGHDIHFREACAAWRRPPPVTELTREQFEAWQDVETKVAHIKTTKERQAIETFRSRAKSVTSQQDKGQDKP